MQWTSDVVCAYTGWPVGHALGLDPDTGPLVPMEAWHLEDPARYEASVAASRALHLSPGDGLSGRILQSGQLRWSTTWS